MIDARIAVPVVITAVGIALVLHVRRSRALGIAVIVALAMAVLVPSFATSAPVAACAVLGAGSVLVVALARCRRHVDLRQTPRFAVAFVLWAGIAGSVMAPIAMVLLYSATAMLLLLLLVATVNADVRRLRPAAGWLFGAVLVVETAAGALEEFFGIPALWPMASGVDLISHRVNSIGIFLPGRALGTVSQPIPYGFLIAFSMLAFLALARPLKRLHIAAAIALGTIGLWFSGSRSIILATGIAVAVWTVLRTLRSRYRVIARVSILLVSLLVLLGGASYEITSGALTTSSFQHRAGVLQSSVDLFGRPPIEVLFGSGFESIPRLFASGIVHGSPGLVVFDNEYVRTFAGLGLTGVALLACVLVQTLRKGAIGERTLLVLLIVSLSSFDALSWRVVDSAFVLVLGLATHAQQPRARAGSLPQDQREHRLERSEAA